MPVGAFLAVEWENRAGAGIVVEDGEKGVGGCRDLGGGGCKRFVIDGIRNGIANGENGNRSQDGGIREVHGRRCGYPD